MLRRVRWFILGLAAGVGGSAWVSFKLVRAGAELTPGGARRALARGLAESLEASSRSLGR